jgi:hypothetical protein
LQGRVKGALLIATRCYYDGSGWGNETPKCPDFDAPDSAITRVGKLLKWCFGPGTARRCFVLKRSQGEMPE